MQVNIQIIPHTQQRYNTVGDWWFVTDPDNLEHLEIRVSQMGDWRYEQAIALHEYYEALLCYNDGVDSKQVDEFDKKFEEKWNAGLITKELVQEPGDMPNAPYYKQHAKALAVEHLFLADTDVVRYLYNEAIDELYRPSGIGVFVEEGK